MANFWRSFNQGARAMGNAYDTYRQVKQNKGLEDAYGIDQQESTEYTPEQVKALTDQAELNGGQWDESKQAYRMPDGGLQAPTNTPTIENGQYQTSQGETVAPTKNYSLGGLSQAQPFSPDQIAGARETAAANVYGQFGDARSAAILGRASQDRQMGKYRLEEAENLAQEARAVRGILKIQGEIASSSISEEEGVSKLIKIADKANGDDSTFTYESVGGGKYRITEHVKDRTIGSRVATLGEIANEALKYTGPNMYMRMQEREDRLAQQGQAQSNFETTRQDRNAAADRSYEIQLGNQDISRQRLEAQKRLARTGGASRPPRRAGIDSDGQPILEAKDGSFYKPDGSDIVNKDWFKKPPKMPSFEEAAAQLDALEPEWREQPRAVKEMLLQRIMSPQRGLSSGPSQLNAAPPEVGSMTPTESTNEKLKALGIQPRRPTKRGMSIGERLMMQESPLGVSSEPQFGPAAGEPIIPTRSLMPR